MNIPIPVPLLGFRPALSAPRQQEDMVRTRMVIGNDSALIPVPGLRSVERVRFRGGAMPDQIDFKFPVDAGMRDLFSVSAPCYHLHAEVPGEEYLERSIYSNDGRWQDGEHFWVTGEWDEEINPPTLKLGPPPETIRRPFVTTGPAEMGEVSRASAARRAKVEAGEAAP